MVCVFGTVDFGNTIVVAVYEVRPRQLAREKPVERVLSEGRSIWGMDDPGK